uniref:Uncharacterized protein n=1 Tax=Arundo donax TaxID=35708 RepID=A0A0A9BYP4_ARUDO
MLHISPRITISHLLQCATDPWKIIHLRVRMPIKHYLIGHHSAI